MKRRNVSALAGGLMALLMVTTVAYAGISADAASEKPSTAAKETLVVVDSDEEAANLATKKYAGIASILNYEKLGKEKDFRSESAIAANTSLDTVEEKLAKGAKAVEEKQQEKEAQWEGRAIASNVEKYVYVRSEAKEDSKAVGMLPKGAAGDVIEKGEEWTHISSGEVEGYVDNDYLAFDEEALEVAEEVCDYVATAEADLVTIRQKPKEDAKILETVSHGDEFIVLEDGVSWVKVASTEHEGYMMKSVVNVELDLAVATPLEPEETKASQEENEEAEETTEAGNYEEIEESEPKNNEQKEEGKQEPAIEAVSKATTSNGATFKVTAYCSCSKCCGPYANGITATGTQVAAGRTIAVDKNVIPLGTTVYINGVAYVAEDTGVRGKTIDLYMDSHSAALQWGVQYCTVTW